MKTALLALLLSASTAFAEPSMPLPAAGTYDFHGDIRVDLQIHHQLVYAFTDAGSADLKRREAAGEECTFKNNDIYLCRTFSKAGTVPPAVRDRLHSLLDNQALVLGDRSGDPALMSKGDNIAEYSVSQPASFLGKNYPGYRLDSNRAGWSMRLGDVTEAQFNLEDGEPRYAIDVYVRQSREVSDTYVVSAGFRRM